MDRKQARMTDGGADRRKERQREDLAEYYNNLLETV